AAAPPWRDPNRARTCVTTLACRLAAVTPWRSAIIAIALVATATAVAAQQQDTIRGRVLSSTNNPLANARIVLVVWGDSAAQKPTHSDSAGNFLMTRAAGPRAYVLTAAR